MKKFQKTNKVPKSAFLSSGRFPIVSQEKGLINGYWEDSNDLFKVDKPVVIFGDHTKVIKLVDFDFVMGADGVKVFLPVSGISSRFFAYYLQSIKLPDLGYARHYRLLKDVIIPVPSEQEQKQIVEILNKAFATIDQAQANIEQNIENAKALFQAQLTNTFSSDSFDEQVKLPEVLKLKSGDALTAKNMVDGKYPVYGGNGIAGFHNRFNRNAETVVIGRVGALCGNARLVNQDFWLTDNAFEVICLKQEFDPKFLTYLLNEKSLRSYARQAAQPVISNSSLKDVVLNFPSSKQEQIRYRNQLEAIEGNLEEVTAAYENKLLSLEELRGSLLQKAFNGELTQ